MQDRTRLVVVGGVAGGASAAARARRLDENAEIILIERGEFVSFANCGLPYHIGGDIEQRDRLLVQTPATLQANLRLDVRTLTEVLSIDRQRMEVMVRDLRTGADSTIPYDKLILSPGAEPIRLPIPGSDDSRVMTLRNITDMDAIIQAIEQGAPSRAVILGGGYIGLEMAEALRRRALDVTMVELSHQVMAPIDPEMAFPLHQHLRSHGVDLRLQTSITAIQANDHTLTAQLSNGDSLECGLIILAVGVKPETRLACEAGLDVGERGGIVVDQHMRTSDPEIYAVGDAVEVRDLVGGFETLIPLAGPANRQGRIAADNAMGRDSVYRDTQGTGICKVFDLAVGMTGMNEKSLQRAGRAYEKIYIHPASHASYYPGAVQISLKLLFDPLDGKILGAQVVGADGVDKRIDVLAVAIRAGMSVYDLEDLELAYAPPYGSAKDPVNYAGFVAGNALRGDVALCHTEDIQRAGDDKVLLDVRTPPEVAAGTIPGALAIPLQQLRERSGELPRDKEMLVFCQVGLRGYLACRILKQKGYQCRNLTGGYKTYGMVTGCAPAPRPDSPSAPSDDSGTSSPDASEKSEPAREVRIVDACGLQCPGPIMRVAEEVQALLQGQAVKIISTDPAFAADIESWCHSTGNHLDELVKSDGKYAAIVRKGESMATHMPSQSPRKKTMVVFSSDFDRAVASFIIANGAAAMGSDVTMFFTFWGLNVLRRPESVSVRKNLIEKMFGAMMPRGAQKLSLSRMNMGGMGLAMIKGIMKKKNVPSLPELIDSAQRAGVRLVACTMSMDLMGIKREELIDGVQEGGVAMYLDHAEAGTVNLFI